MPLVMRLRVFVWLALAAVPASSWMRELLSLPLGRVRAPHHAARAAVVVNSRGYGALRDGSYWWCESDDVIEVLKSTHAKMASFE